MHRREVTVIAKAIAGQRNAVIKQYPDTNVRAIAIKTVHDVTHEIAEAIKAEYPSFRDDLFIKAALLD